MKKLILALVAVAAILAGGFVYTSRHDIARSLERASLPEAKEYNQLASGQLPMAENSVPAPNIPATSLPAEVNLAIPFTPQAPHANWDYPYKEFCEEASTLMAVSYLTDQAIPNPDFADQAMLQVRTFEEQRFGYYEDTTAAETAAILQEHFGISQVQLIADPTVAQIKAAVAEGRPVIVPAAGRQLGNPYFTAPGPLYHMIVVKGYTSDGKFIVNDPGTRRGADYVYDEATLMNAMHDWRDDKQIELGRKVVIVVG